MLTATNLRVSIDGTEILRGVDFVAQPGEVTAIVGPNGSGKSTLLAALTGAQDYDGEARMGVLDLAQAKPWELAARRAVLAQFTSVAFPFTVSEVVRIGGGAPDLTEAALGRVGLTHYAARPYHALSGGEQQRVQLARVLTQVWRPMDAGVARWLILDEPVSSLDIAHQLEVMEIARTFAAEGGGVVAVMHDLNLTAMFADSVALMAGGLVVRQGPVDEVLTNETLSGAYGCRVQVNTAPPGGTFVLPQAAQA
ncbi:MAG: heme ABC transporter ATP-binding protein [Pseudomonadota bacterium]|nr:heme ABC transporter ATP-binding protein [Pseudomonadota bacterium]